MYFLKIYLIYIDDGDFQHFNNKLKYYHQINHKIKYYLYFQFKYL